MSGKLIVNREIEKITVCGMAVWSKAVVTEAAVLIAAGVKSLDTRLKEFINNKIDIAGG